MLTRTDIELSVFKALALVDKATPDNDDIRELTLPRETYWNPLSKRIGAMELNRFAYTQAKELNVERLKKEVLLPTWHIIRWNFQGNTGYIEYVTSSQDLISYWNNKDEKVLKRTLIEDLQPYWTPATLKNFTIKLRIEETGFIRNPWVPPPAPPSPSERNTNKISAHLPPAHQQQLLANLIPPTLIPRIRFVSATLVKELTTWTSHVFDADCWTECLLKPITSAGPLGFLEVKLATIPDLPFTPPPHIPYNLPNVVSPPGAPDPTKEKNQPALKEQTGQNQKLFFH